jgi:N-acyl-D-amino-acid deacylase
MLRRLEKVKRMRVFRAALFFCVLSLPLDAAVDLVLRNGLVYDGTGRPPVQAHVSVHQGEIVAVDRNPVRGRQTLDATGLVVAPGFIDVHTHAENIVYHAKAENFLRMGVTTLVLGNCGSSKLDIGQFFERMSQIGFSPNIASLIGHGTVRNQVMGGSLRRPPAADELKQMRQHITKAMNDGALGMSTGLIYLPGTFAKTDELIALAQTVSAYDGIYVSHMRSEGTNIFKAVDEVCRIGREAQVPVHISHLKLAGRPMWGRHHELLGKLDAARKEGIRLTHDQYAYTASSTSLKQLLPDELMAGGRAAYAQRIKDREQYAKTATWMKTRLKARQRDDYSYAVIAWHKKTPRYNGLNVPQAAQLRYGAATLDHQIALIMEVELNGGASAVFHGMSEADARAFLKHPKTMFASDSSVRAFNQGVPHPRGYGNAGRFLGHYVREQKQLPLGEVIRKLTDLPARTFQLKGRGRIQPGFAGDIVVFDPAKITDHATFKNPHAYTTGFQWVIVNGQIVVEGDRHNGAGPGQIIRRAQ